MFTGIVRGTAYITHIREADGGKDWIASLSETIGALHEGQSVALDGVCLTVAEIAEDTVRFRVMNESLSKTTLGHKTEGDRVNIEPSLTPNEELGGHFVYGHVDGIGHIVSLQADGENWLITVEVPEEIGAYVVPQGAVAIDGISLTIARQPAPTRITISVIPYTWQITNLQTKHEGDGVNLEADMMVKTVVSYLQRKGY